ncbi:hypothetical protein SAMN02799630_00047 [Paenibacillus sp. UNCCL117]|uniref:hypothetical protein n=1 Tax=unclassified Paenibacillus TaxID=185978 RepID=UPI000882C64C|nr:MULTISPECIES: hypothetical protein [unclassified Paenibacillus]SDC54573.1 hypothetical protein SAMN04488602_102485 [Paenibacillus sp. cl123]SFW11036.1 hypothetical protein SAMN02799630_00047 [Paenibacillus sp. UNCCL117]
MINNEYKNEDLKTVKEHEKFAEKKGSDKPISEVINGSMAPDLEEVKRLGEDMKEVKTEGELAQEGLVPDPIQRD